MHGKKILVAPGLQNYFLNFKVWAWLFKGDNKSYSWFNVNFEASKLIGGNVQTYFTLSFEVEHFFRFNLKLYFENIFIKRTGISCQILILEQHGSGDY